MNLSQLMALAKLRFKLTTNQIKKSGKLNTIIATIFYAIGAILVATSFFIAATLGALFYSRTDPFSMVMMWNIVAALFLFMWIVQLIGELQQTELISLDKLLHLPVSLRGAFFLNYTSTFFCGTFLFFAPMMLGMCVGMMIGLGWHMAISIPLVLSFLFLVTSLTHQLRGWLGGLMENKRSKGTIGAFLIILIIVATQIPNLVMQTLRTSREDAEEIVQTQMDEERLTALALLDAAKPLDSPTAQSKTWEVLELNTEFRDRKSRRRAIAKKARREQLADTIKTVDKYFPPGWMPLGIFNAYQGRFIQGILGSLGMFAIGLISFTLSYRSSMRKYTGFAKRKPKTQAKPKPAPNLDFMFKDIPFCSDSISNVTLASFRGLIRSPETKMMLIMPIVLAMLGFAYFFSGSDITIPQEFWPCVPIGAIALTMFSIASSTFNQFGMDRDGFRAFVLSPVERRDILIGKNLALAPIAAGVAVLLLIVLQFIFPCGPLFFLANLIQIPCNYLLYCLAGNTASIYFPMGIKRGTMQPVNPKFLPMLILVIATFMLPSLLLVPTMVAVSIPMLLEFNFGWNADLLYLIATIAQIALTVALYAYVVKFQGYWLWVREPKILDQVANIPE